MTWGIACVKVKGETSANRGPVRKRAHISGVRNAKDVRKPKQETLDGGWEVQCKAL